MGMNTTMTKLLLLLFAISLLAARHRYLSVRAYHQRQNGSYRNHDSIYGGV